MNDEWYAGFLLICALVAGFLVGVCIDKTVDTKMIEAATLACHNRGGLLSLQGTIQRAYITVECVDGTLIEKDLAQ